jgi:uncharacterized protein
VSPEAILLALLFLLAAVLYSSVGHAGASAYLAAMALIGLAPEVMRPTALVLNLAVASIVIVRFSRAGHLPWRQLTPLVVASIPMAFLGGLVQLPGEVYRPLVGLVLLVAAWRLATTALRDEPERTRVPALGGLAIGATIGLLAGLTGTGGGIFLSPIVIILGWSDLRTTSGIAAVFILGNSLAGLLGNVAVVRALPPELPLYAVAVILGAFVGTAFGTRFAPILIQRALGLVLIVAGFKLIGVY